MEVKEFINQGAKPGDVFYMLAGDEAQQCRVVAVTERQIAYEKPDGGMSTVEFSSFIGRTAKDTLTEAIDYFSKLVDRMKENRLKL